MYSCFILRVLQFQLYDPCQVYDSEAPITFRMSCSHHHYLLQNFFITEIKTLYTLSSNSFFSPTFPVPGGNGLITNLDVSNCSQLVSTVLDTVLCTTSIILPDGLLQSFPNRPYICYYSIVGHPRSGLPWNLGCSLKSAIIPYHSILRILYCFLSLLAKKPSLLTTACVDTPLLTLWPLPAWLQPNRSLW